MREYELGEKSQLEIAREYGLSGRSSVSVIVKTIKKQLQDGLINADPNSKRLRKGYHEDLDQCLIKWVQEERRQNNMITGDMISNKACWFANQLNIDNFKASPGYVSNFKARNGLVSKRLPGRGDSFNTEIVEQFRGNLAGER